MIPEVGHRVRHPRCPDWGKGEVLAVSSDGKITVDFVNVGQKTLKGVVLERIDGADAADPRLDNRIRGTARGDKNRSIAQLKAAFLHRFPGGFKDLDYLVTERNYKVEASRLLLSTMSASVLIGLTSTGDHGEVCRRALTAVNATNLIFPNEKMDLKDGLARPDHAAPFAKAMTRLLYGGGDFETRFVAFAGVLETLGAPTWTIATYFPFLAFPDQHMFLKPVVTQRAAEACDFELHYRSQVNPQTYGALLRFCRVLREVVVDLDPRDMIDLQSFIWCIGQPS